MPESSNNRVVIDRVDWESVLPVLRLASAFKHALQPGKLVVALVAVLLLHGSGLLLDAAFGASKNNYLPDGPQAYETITSMQAEAFDGLTRSAMALDHGFGQGSQGVADALYSMLIGIPALAFSEYPLFVALYGLAALLVFILASGVICRMSSTQVCANRSTSLSSAACFVRKRWAWYLLTPLMPTMLIAVVGAILALAGLVFFNIPGVDVVGALLYGLLLLLGFVIAVVTLLLLLALFLMPPALSVEGSDGFDAVARSFNYILFRPWQFAAYLFACIVYLAVVYVVVGAVASLSVNATGYFIGLGVVSDSELTKPATWIASRWTELVTAIVVAILFSTFCCLQTQVYVLMRRSADGTPMDQCEGGEQGDLWADTPSTDQTDNADELKAEG